MKTISEINLRKRPGGYSNKIIYHNRKANIQARNKEEFLSKKQKLLQLIEQDVSLYVFLAEKLPMYLGEEGNFQYIQTMLRWEKKLGNHKISQVKDLTKTDLHDFLDVAISYGYRTDTVRKMERFLKTHLQFLGMPSYTPWEPKGEPKKRFLTAHEFFLLRKFAINCYYDDAFDNPITRMASLVIATMAETGLGLVVIQNLKPDNFSGQHILLPSSNGTCDFLISKDVQKGLQRGVDGKVIKVERNFLNATLRTLLHLLGFPDLMNPTDVRASYVAYDLLKEHPDFSKEQIASVIGRDKYSSQAIETGFEMYKHNNNENPIPIHVLSVDDDSNIPSETDSETARIPKISSSEKIVHFPNKE